ncbi:MAG TPA: DinB family protein [Terracidiphilus sp.]|nr:DinB family protein [Terracidiphilus sp.]
MNELEQALVGESYAAPPSHILEALTEELSHRRPAGAPHSIYEELWHIAFWQRITLDWIGGPDSAGGIETPYPASPADGFPTVLDMEREPWPSLCERFFAGANAGAAAARDEPRLNQPVRCPSRPGHPVRIMSVRDQLESLAAHNAYHLGRIVLLRQMIGAWPPPSGGFKW